jgi:hypothetical protein
MSEGDLFLVFVREFDALGLTYMLTGSVASTLYGEPRVTHDVDVVLELSPRMVRQFAAAFPLERFYCPPEEVLRQEVLRRQRGHFNLIAQDTGFKADVYLANEDPLHAAALAVRRRIVVDGVGVWVAPPEYVIVRKLEFYREGRSEKHLRDIRAMLRVSGELIDLGRLTAWVDRLGLQSEWSLVRSSVEASR